jgi:hypothetical protein
MNIVDMYANKSQLLALVNINAMVMFKFTKEGKNINDHIMELYRFKEDENGVVSTQLWEVMRLFGPHLFIGATPVFEENSFCILPNNGCLNIMTLREMYDKAKGGEDNGTESRIEEDLHAASGGTEQGSEAP